MPPEADAPPPPAALLQPQPAAAGHHSRSCWRWYAGERPAPEVSAKAAEAAGTRTPARRFCGGRLSLAAFIAVHALAAVVLLAALFGPLTYFVFVPNALRAAFTRDRLFEFRVGSFNITAMTNTSAEFALAGSLPRPSAVGVSVGVRGPLVFRVWRADDPTAATVLTLTADAPLSFTTNADIAVATTGRIVFADMRSLRDALACTACAAGSKTGFVVGTQITVDIAGTTWYRDLALQFALDIAPPGAATPGSDALGSWLPKPFVAPNLNTVIRQKFAAGDLLPLGPGLPDVHVDSLSIVNWTTPGSVVLSLRAMFENPVTASFNTSRAIFGFGSVSGTTHSDVARVTVTPASTAASAGISFVFPGIIDTSVTAEIKFVDPTLAAMSPLLAALSFTLYPSTHPDMTLDGPLQLVAVSGGGDLVGAMTNGTVIHLDHDSISTALSRLRSIVIAQALKQGITGIGL